jgi:hypothetical protein
VALCGTRRAKPPNVMTCFGFPPVGAIQVLYFAEPSSGISAAYPAPPCQCGGGGGEKEETQQVVTPPPVAAWLCAHPKVDIAIAKASWDDSAPLCGARHAKPPNVMTCFGFPPVGAFQVLYFAKRASGISAAYPATPVPVWWDWVG